MRESKIKEKLYQEIIDLKKTLVIRFQKHKDPLHPEVLKISESLDRKIFEYQKLYLQNET